MRINPILNNYNSNSSFKGSIDKSLVNYIKSAEKQQTVRLKPAKDCDKFLGLMEQFMLIQKIDFIKKVIKTITIIILLMKTLLL